MNNQWKNIQHMREGTCLVLVKEDVLRRAYFEDINHTGWAIVEGERKKSFAFIIKRIYIAVIKIFIISLNATTKNPKAINSFINKC